MNKEEQNKVKRNTKKKIKELLKMIENKAFSTIDKAITCGALAEDSDFLKDNFLLATALVSDASRQFQIKTDGYKAEENNLIKFI